MNLCYMVIQKQSLLYLSQEMKGSPNLKIATKIQLLLKGFRFVFVFLVNRRQIFLNLFVFRYSTFPAEVALFTICLFESYLCLFFFNK